LHESRKLEHLEICLNKNVQSATTTGLERYRLVHRALPEMALCDVDTRLRFLGRGLAAPLLISAMTGGTEMAQMVNSNLATAAQALGLGMGLGSQRAGLEDDDLMDTYRVRHIAPDILLLANLGAVQLNYGYGPEQCLRAVEGVGADALVLHLNPLQEALQPEGNTDFGGLLAKIEEVCRRLPIPVMVKEVGWGLSGRDARLLRQAGVAGLDVAGAGGTSWSEVERHRSASPEAARVARVFAAWGNPTAEALVEAREACPGLPIVASGGLSNGIEAAICLALGANVVGVGLSILRAATNSAETVQRELQVILSQLRVAMFCTGARTLGDLDRSHLTKR
jgi:isopentenyl-diphosphate delta-isomerase